LERRKYATKAVLFALISSPKHTPKADNVPSDYDEVYNRQNDILYLDRNSRYDEMVAHPATIPMTKDSICSASLTIRQFATTDIKTAKARYSHQYCCNTEYHCPHFRL